MKSCYNCNTQFDENTDICPKCGAVNDYGATVEINWNSSNDLNQNSKHKNNPIIIAAIVSATVIVLAVIVAIIIISTNKQSEPQEPVVEYGQNQFYEEIPSSTTTTTTVATTSTTQEMVVYNYNYYYDSSGSPYGTPHNDFSFDYYSDYDYLFPSDKYLLTTDFLDTKTQDEIDLIRNEIYARHGYIFQMSKFRNYFEKKAWYHGTDSSMENVAKKFNSIEQKNIRILVKYQNL